MRISIVTPTLNRAPFLRAAIESVRAQEGAEVEHLVVDGLSTDGTSELLVEYPKLRVISEKDAGLYDAINKGLAAATGDVIGLLNSDDVYLPGTFQRVAAAFADPAVEAVSGGAEIVNNSGQVRHRFVRRAETELNFRNVTVGPLTPNARFFRRSFVQQVGFYDLRYRVAADRDWLFRAVLAQPRAVTIEQVLYRYREHAGSLTFSGDAKQAALWREEYLTLAERQLDQPELPSEARSGCRQWHRRESAQAATRAVLAGEWKSAAACARRGWRRDASWPMMFLRHLGGALLPPR